MLVYSHKYLFINWSRELIEFEYTDISSKLNLIHHQSAWMSSAAFNPCHVGNQFCWNEKLRAVGRGRKSDVVNLLLDGWEANNACGPDVVTIHHNEQTLSWISKSCYSNAFILDQRAHHLGCQTLTSTHHCSLQANWHGRQLFADRSCIGVCDIL